MKKIQFFVEALMLLAAKNVMTVDYLHAEVLKKIERHPLNRETKPAAVQKLMNKIREGRIVTTICMSDLNGYCLDGEHRRAALLKLWENGECLDVTVNVEFIHCETEKDEIDTMIRLNRGNKCWNLDAFANKLEKEHNDSMLQLKDFIKRNNIEARGRGAYTQASLLLYGTRRITSLIKNSDTQFVITSEEFAEAERRLAEIRAAFHYIDADFSLLKAIFQGVANGWYKWHKTQAYQEKFAIYTAEEAGIRIGKMMKKNHSTAGDSGEKWFNYLMTWVSSK
jgi:hypothetical protein